MWFNYLVFSQRRAVAFYAALKYCDVKYTPIKPLFMRKLWNNGNHKKKSAWITYAFQILYWIMRGLQARIPRTKYDHSVLVDRIGDRSIAKCSWYLPLSPSRRHSATDLEWQGEPKQVSKYSPLIKRFGNGSRVISLCKLTWEHLWELFANKSVERAAGMARNTVRELGKS
jgi:hypothetical protein